jgi:hypothetical protein
MREDALAGMGRGGAFRVRERAGADRVVLMSLRTIQQHSSSVQPFCSTYSAFVILYCSCLFALCRIAVARELGWLG